MLEKRAPTRRSRIPSPNHATRNRTRLALVSGLDMLCMISVAWVLPIMLRIMAMMVMVPVALKTSGWSDWSVVRLIESLLLLSVSFDALKWKVVGVSYALDSMLIQAWIKGESPMELHTAQVM